MGLASHQVRHSRRRLEVAALDLSGSLEEVLKRVDDLAYKARKLRSDALAAA